MVSVFPVPLWLNLRFLRGPNSENAVLCVSAASLLSFQFRFGLVGAGLQGVGVDLGNDLL